MKHLALAFLLVATPAVAQQNCLLTNPPQCDGLTPAPQVETIELGTLTMSSTAEMRTEPFSIEDAVKGLAMIMHHAEAERERGVKKAMLKAATHLRACIDSARENSQAVLPEGSC